MPPAARADAVPLDDGLAAAVAAVVASADQDGIDTTLTRLQARTGQPTPLLRDALSYLAGSHLAVLRRHGEPVDDVTALTEHARFQLIIRRG